MADLFDILKGLEQWAGSQTPQPGAIPASMGALRASEAGALPTTSVNPNFAMTPERQKNTALAAVQPTLAQMGQQYYSALSRGDVAGARQIHQKANSIRQSIGLTPGVDYDPATGYMHREGDVRPLGSINIEQEIARESARRTGQPALEVRANPYMNTASESSPLQQQASGLSGSTSDASKWQNAFGAVNQFGVQMEQAAPDFWKRVDNPFKPGSDWQQDPATGKLVWNPANPQSVRREYLNTPGAQMVAGSPLASGTAQLVGASAPWLVAGELTGGLADVAGLGGTALQGAPWATRLAVGAGRGAVEGGLVSAMQQDAAREVLRNILFGTMWNLGPTAMETVPGLRNLPQIIGKPLGVYAGVAGASALDNALFQQRQNQTRAALSNGS